MKTDKELELEDIADQAEVVGKLSPIEYAKLRGMQSQLVYYYIRTNVIQDERCVCGRRVIDVRNADEALAEKARARRGSLDTRPDELRTESAGQGSVVSGVPEADTMEED
jgi:hypothetical protein